MRPWGPWARSPSCALCSFNAAALSPTCPGCSGERRRTHSCWGDRAGMRGQEFQPSGFSSGDRVALSPAPATQAHRQAAPWTAGSQRAPSRPSARSGQAALRGLRGRRDNTGAHRGRGARRWAEAGVSQGRHSASNDSGWRPFPDARGPAETVSLWGIGPSVTQPRLHVTRVSARAAPRRCPWPLTRVMSAPPGKDSTRLRGPPPCLGEGAPTCVTVQMRPNTRKPLRLGPRPRPPLQRPLAAVTSVTSCRSFT